MGDFSTLLFKEGEGSGTTADAYADLEFDIRTKKAITIRLKNTDAANGLTYRVDSYANFDGTVGIPKEEVAAANVAAAGIVEIALPKTAEYPKKLAKVVLQVKSQVAATPATYAYESIAGRY
jgi:hypothetical protein